MSESGEERQQQGGNRRRRGGGNNNNNNNGNNNNNQSDEKELASQLVQVDSKRFYIDVKENDRGRFIKLAEVSDGGRRSRILMNMPAASEFKTRLQEFSELHESLGPVVEKPEGEKQQQRGSQSQNNEDGNIKSEQIVNDRKRYYLDLKENARGRFLRVSQVVSVPNNRGPRAYLAIPAEGLAEFQQHLSDMLDNYSEGYMDDDNYHNNDHQDNQNNDKRSNNQKSSRNNNNNGGGNGGDNQAQIELPEAKFFRGGNKSFYFDGGSNQRGSFLKISEVRQNRYRTSITVSHEHAKQFRDQLNEYIEAMSALGLDQVQDQDQPDQKKTDETKTSSQ